MSQVQTYTWGQDFQLRVLATMAREPRFILNFSDVISPDYFDFDDYKLVCKLLLEYIERYQNIPTHDVTHQLVYEATARYMITPERAGRVGAIVNQMYEMDISDSTFVMDRVVKFGQRQALRRAIFQCMDLLNKDEDYDQARSFVDKALLVGSSTWDIGTTTDALHGIYDLCRQDSVYNRELRIPTTLQTIDKSMDGGIGPGELGFIVGPTKIGKSITLMNFGFGAILTGRPLIYITLELKEIDVILRMASRITGVPMKDITQGHQRENYQNGMRIFRDKYRPLIYVKYFPPKSIGVGGIRSYVSRLYTKEKVPPGGLIIVDYMDKLKSKFKDDSNTYLSAGSLCEELIGFGHDFGVGIWTGSQTNKKALGFFREDHNGVLEMDYTADSFRKMMDCDVAITLNASKEDKDKNILRLYVAGSRRSPDAFEVRCHLEKEKMYLYEGS